MPWTHENIAHRPRIYGHSSLTGQALCLSEILPDGVRLYSDARKMSDTGRLKATVFVGGLDNAVSSGVLHSAFVPFGDIVDISLPKPDLASSTDLHRGFGYVEFESAVDAREAIDNMDQSELFGRVIKVAQAKPQKDSNEGLGSQTAVWEQVC